MAARTGRRSTLYDLPQYNRDVEVQYYQDSLMFEPQYPFWWNIRLIIDFFTGIIESTLWNSYICIIVLVAVLLTTINVEYKWFTHGYNISYAIHVLAIAYNAYAYREIHAISWRKILGLIVDVFSFTHYFYPKRGYRFICYYIRLHRPFQYLWTLTNYNLKGSVVGTTLKYCYIFIVVRMTWAIIWLMIDEMEKQYAEEQRGWSIDKMDQTALGQSPTLFLSAVYIVNKMFIPIGPSVTPVNDVERVICMLVMLTGCLVVGGAAVASMSLVISMYMRPEETFRARYLLIMKQMKETHVSPSQRDKVETFYKMYWQKQKAVSSTQLLPTFPPTLSATIQCDIYFEATQKSRILRDLSYEFLTEVTKKMETRRFIPGDTIIKRLSNKSSTIYITSGDIEIVTAEDDATAILRMSRGTILTPCGACTPAGLGRAHVEVRAATFCLAHVLEAKDLWKVAVKYGKDTDQSSMIYDAFITHMEMVQRHYRTKVRETVKHRSSILHFKRCLMALKEARDANGDLLLARTDVFLEIAGCYIMRNRPDSSLIDESDAICLRPTFPCILQPNSSLTIAWNLFIACIIITVCFVHPYYLVYEKIVPIEFRFFDYVVTGIFLIDLLVDLSTGANVEEGVPITFTQISAQQMRSHWFVLDVLATIPLFEFIDTGHFAGINKLLRLPKVFRVLKNIEDMCVYHSNVIRFLSYTLLMIIACYLIASLQQGFMCFYFDYCRVTNFTHTPYWEKKPLDEETVEHRVTFGLYWAISMLMFTIHMETWGTLNWQNILYTMFLLEVCVVLRIFMEAVYSATIMVTTSLREDYDATISMVKSCFIRNELDPVLRQRFITYLQLCWYTDKAYAMTNKRSIFYDLPPHVYQDIVAKQRVKYLLTIPFMKYLNKEDLKIVSSDARLFYTSPNEILVNTGDICNEMYVIAQGICEILDPLTEQPVALLHERCHFGVFVCLFRVPAYYTIRAVTHVQVFSIDLRSLSLPFTRDPFLRDILEDIKHQPGFQGICTPRAPFVSYVPPAPATNIERFLLPRKHEVDYAFLQPFYRLGFFSVLRYIFPRFTIRPDGPYMIRYECFRAACALVGAMLYPCFTYLCLEWHELYYFTYFLDCSAYFDVIQRMLIGYYTPEGILVYHPASTAAHYARGAMIIDLIACLPWEDLQGFIIIGDRYRVSEMDQFLVLTRLLQLYRLQSIMLVLDDYIERKDLLMVVRAIPMFITLLNVLTSFVVLYSAEIFFSTDFTEYEIVPYDDVGGSWIKLFSNTFRYNVTGSIWNLHLTAYFWVVYETTTTGYGCLNPSNLEIMRILLAGMLTGAMMITFFSVRIISLRANVNKTLAEFQEHMKDMIIWMKKEKLDINLQRDVFEHYEYNWDKMGGVEYNSVFKLCDQITLRTDAILHVYGPTFSKCPILSSVEVSVLRMIGRASYSMHFLRGMTVIECDDVTSDIYFVDYGGIQARYTHDDLSVVETLLRGSLFGNLEGEATIRCPVAFVATSRVHLLRINSKTFHKIIKEFPDVLEVINKYKSETKKQYYIKGGEAGDSLHPWKERNLSAPVVVRNRRSIIKFFYFKDNVVQTYLILVSVFCIYLDVYNAGFQDNRLGVIIALYILDVAFYVKLVLYLLLPMLLGSAQAREILLHKRKHYIRGDFKYDVISCVPVELFCLLGEENLWMLFSWLRLNRIFRVVTVFTCLKRYRERITVNLGLVTIWAVTIWFSLSVHIISCLWYYIGTVNDKYQPGSSWIHKDDHSSWCHNTYICSLYFIMTTFTQNGVGDIIPKMQSEVIFVCILQIISTMVCMVYVGEFSNIIQYKSFRSFSFYSKYLELQEFLKNNRVSRNLVTQVNRYSLHLWRESRGYQSPHFLQTAPQSLRLTVMADAYLRHIRLHYIFKDCEPAFLRQLVGCFQVYTYDKNMFVVKAYEITDSMYFIHRGKVTDLSENLDFKSTVYSVGTSFGLHQGLKHKVPFTESFRTLTKAQVLTLRLDDWLPILKLFPTSAAAIASHDRDVGTDGGGHGGPPGHRGSRADSEGQPHVRRTKPRITELVDRGTEPSPPSDTSSSDKPPTPGAYPGAAVVSGADKGGTVPDAGPGEGKKAPRVARFVPPPGPELEPLGPVTDGANRWPTNNRRRGTMYPTAAEKKTAETELAEKETAETELVEKEIAETELAEKEIAETELAEKETAENELTETNIDTTSPPSETSRWPTNNRRETVFFDRPNEKETAETEQKKTNRDAASSPAGTSRWPTNNRRETVFFDRPYASEEDAAAETELAEMELGSAAAAKHETPPNTSSSSDASAKSKTSFFKRVVTAMKKLVPKRSRSASGEIRFSTSEESERATIRLSRSQSEDNNDEEYIARLERDLGRLSHSSNTDMAMMVIPPETKTAKTQEAVDIATAPDDADVHSAAETAHHKAISLARLKRKSVRVRYEDMEDMEGRGVGDSDESDPAAAAAARAAAAHLELMRTSTSPPSPSPTDDDPANTSEKDSSGSSHINIDKKKKK